MEAKNSEYFIDGFMIRHFSIYPQDFDKDNLFDEQKIFLMYLLGSIPDLEMWQKDVAFKHRLEEIKMIKDVPLSESELTIAELHGSDIEDMKRNKLREEKRRQEKELREKYGYPQEEEDYTDDNAAEPETKVSQDPQNVWDMLQGKGIIKNG